MPVGVVRIVDGIEMDVIDVKTAGPLIIEGVDVTLSGKRGADNQREPENDESRASHSANYMAPGIERQENAEIGCPTAERRDRSSRKIRSAKQPVLHCLPPKHIIDTVRLPPEVREQFRRHGRAGGRARAARLTVEERTGVARRAALARWVRQRFGASRFGDLGLPGGEIVDSGLADLAAGRISAESLAVSIAMPRLQREGLPLIPPHPHPEDRLYELLSRRSGDLAHARYNAYLRQLSSFANACHGRRLDRMKSAP